MRVVTFNIRNGAAEDGPFGWTLRRGEFLDFLKRLDADVLCLQEVLDFQLDEIRAALPAYECVGVGRDDGLRAGEFAPILHRRQAVFDAGTFWLSETPTAPGSRAWGANLPRICTWAQLTELTIANLHLDHQSETARRNGVELVLRRLRADLVCGDFNAEPGEACIDAMLAAGYADLGHAAGGTFNAFMADAVSAPRIDCIFGLPSAVGSALVVRDPIVSDHWPLVVDLEARS